MTLLSHRILGKHAVLLAAVLALLGQSLFPHVHAWHGRSALPTHVAAADRCTADCPTTIRAATATDDGRDGDPHSSSSCPLCRAQSDARSLLLLPAFAVPLPVAAPATFVADVVLATAAVVPSVAAPRAPPLAS